MMGGACFIWEAHHNFNKRDLRGCNIEVLPFVRVFPPQRARRHANNFTRSLDGYGRGWTIHFGWLYWTVIVHSRQRVVYHAEAELRRGA
jgi:hypothetical protein